jgi:hypothetical protein
LGRTFAHGTVLDPETTCPVAARAVDPISGLTNTSASTIYVRDPFYTGGSISGITNFANSTSQLNVIPASRLDMNSVKLLQLLPQPTRTAVYPLMNDYFTVAPETLYTNQCHVRIDENDRRASSH